MVGWGASSDEWATLDLVLGLTEDLLPVVSNPNARISPKSSLKTLGKTPSLYNGHDLVIGIPRWTEKIATGDEIERWAQVPDYGLCLQTRRVRALDIDVPDAALSSAIVAFIESHLGIALPRRFREGSGKCLLAFELPGDYGKRSVKVEGGMVEALMTGQQFVACGTHPGGARYVWDGGLPSGFPVLDVGTWEALWTALVARFALEPAVELRRIGRGEDLGLEDEMAAWLVEHWETYGLSSDGRKLFVACPWKAEHTSDSGETEAAWLLRGSGGVERGHFKCLHAHCAGRRVEEFEAAVGYREAQFDDLAQTGGAGAEGAELDQRFPRKGLAETGGAGENALSLPLPGFARKPRSSIIRATLNNVILACEREDVCGVRLAYDEFRDELLVASLGEDTWRPFRDNDAIKLRRHLETIDFDPVGRELMRDAILNVAEARSFDSAKQWLSGLPAWDGVERIATFLPSYMGTADNPYTRAVGLYAWTAHVARILDPGCKADMAVVLVGPQGQLKSSAIAAIAPQRDFFGELSLEKLDENLSRQMRGLIVGEIAELKGLNSRDSDSIRAWITKQWESWTPKFREHKTIFKRRLVLWATTNEDEFLADATGERRWLPCRVGARADAAAIERDRDQLWVEALEIYRKRGVLWQDAERLARDEHHKFKVIDSWEEDIMRWLYEPDLDETTPLDREEVTFAALARDALGLDRARIGRREQIRIANIMRKLGFEKAQKKTGSDNTRIWVQIGSK